MNSSQNYDQNNHLLYITSVIYSTWNHIYAMLVNQVIDRSHNP